MTDAEFDRETRALLSKYRSSDSERKEKARAAARDERRRERAAARSEVRRERRRSRMLRFAGAGAGSVASTILFSFDKVLEILLAILLLFALVNASGGLLTADVGALTPMKLVLMSDRVSKPGEAAFNLGYASIYDQSYDPDYPHNSVLDQGGLGWVVNEENEMEPRYLSLSGLMMRLQDLGSDKTSVSSRGTWTILTVVGWVFGMDVDPDVDLDDDLVGDDSLTDPGITDSDVSDYGDMRAFWDMIFKWFGLGSDGEEAAA